MLRKQWLSVVSPCEHDFMAHAFLDRKASLERVLDSEVHASVPAREEHFHGVVEQACLLEEWTKRCSCSLIRPDGFLESQHVNCASTRGRATRPGALQRDRLRHRRSTRELRERHYHRRANPPSDRDGVIVRTEPRSIETNEKIVRAERRDVVTKQLGVHAVISEREYGLQRTELAPVDSRLRTCRRRLVRNSNSCFGRSTRGWRALG